MRCYAAHRDRLLVLEGVDPTGPNPERVSGHRVAFRGRRLESVASHPDAPDRVLVGTFGAGLQRSTDAGERFERVRLAESDESEAVTAVAVDPRDPDLVWVGTEPSRCYRSTDGGRTFERVAGLTDVPSAEEWSFPPRPDTHHVRWIEPDPAEPDRLYVGVEAGALVVTPDAGATWLDRPPGSRRDTHQLATHADAPGRVYAAAGDGYAESEDGGETWSVRHDGLEHRYVWSVLPDPGEPDRVLVSAASGPGDAHSRPGESYLYRREPGGDWRRLDGPLSGEDRLRAVLASDGRASHAFALNDRGCYASTDFGESWTRLDVPWPDELCEQTARGLAVVPASGS